jgi:hypothetical protein
MRDRSWRRYTQDLKIKKRLLKNRYYYYFRTVNGERIIRPIWCERIGTSEYFFFKLHTTSKFDSKYKTKYSPNKKYSYFRDIRKNLDSLGTRESDKRDFLKILKRYGLR